MNEVFHEERPRTGRVTRTVKSRVRRRAYELALAMYASYTAAMLEQLGADALKPDQVEHWEPKTNEEDLFMNRGEPAA